MQQFVYPSLLPSLTNTIVKAACRPGMEWGIGVLSHPRYLEKIILCKMDAKQWQIREFNAHKFSRKR